MPLLGSATVGLKASLRAAMVFRSKCVAMQPSPGGRQPGQSGFQTGCRSVSETVMSSSVAPSKRWLVRVFFFISLCVITCGVQAWGQAVQGKRPVRPSLPQQILPRATTAPDTSAPAHGVSLRDNRLGIDVQDTELLSILEDIASQGEIDLRHSDALPRKRLSVQFADLPVVEGLKRLFRAAEVDSYVLVTQTQGDAVRVQRILFFPTTASTGQSSAGSRPQRQLPAPVQPPQLPASDTEAKEPQDTSDTGAAASVFEDIKTNTAARRLLSQLVHPNEQVRERALERLVRLVENDDKQAELLEFLEPLMEGLSSEDRTERDEARQEIRKLLRR